jgi:hypothetical protein
MSIVKVEGMNQHTIQQWSARDWNLFLDSYHRRVRALPEKAQRFQSLLSKIFARRGQCQADAIQNQQLGFLQNASRQRLELLA